MQVRIIILLLFFFASTTGVMGEENKYDNRLVLISVDDKTYDAVNTFPIGRNYYAKIIKALSDYYKPKFIIYDSIIDLPGLVKEHDEIFYKSILKVKGLYFAAAVNLSKKINIKLEKYTPLNFKKSAKIPCIDFNGGYFPRNEILNNGGGIVVVSIFPDKNNYYNTGSTLFNYNGAMFPSPSYMVLHKKFGKNIEFRSDKVGKRQMFVNGKEMPINDSGLFFINYNYNFKEFSFIDIVNKTVPPTKIKNKIVIIGNRATGIGDYHPTSKSLKTYGSFMIGCSILTLLDFAEGE